MAVERGWALRAARLAAADLAAWSLVALLFAVQGHVTALYHGRPQPWWPSFAYSLAMFSVWAALTPPLVWAARRIEARVARPGARLLLYAAGVPVAAGLQIGLFALVFWPLYNDHGRIASRWAMAERMFLPNFAANLVFYLVLVAGAAAWLRLEQARAVRAAPVPPPAAPGFVRVRSRGVTRLVPPERIDWIGAAGDYSEIHTAEGSFLADESLASLAARLPAEAFARIHRRAIVRLDRISEVRSLGRGDALLRLATGQELRLSRRFRGRFAAWKAAA